MRPLTGTSLAPFQASRYSVPVRHLGWASLGFDLFAVEMRRQGITDNDRIVDSYTAHMGVSYLEGCYRFPVALSDQDQHNLICHALASGYGDITQIEAPVRAMQCAALHGALSSLLSVADDIPYAGWNATNRTTCIRTLFQQPQVFPDDLLDAAKPGLANCLKLAAVMAGTLHERMALVQAFLIEATPAPAVLPADVGV